MNKRVLGTDYIKSLGNGMAFAVGLLAIFGGYLFVSAITPSTVVNPTFSPTTDDVVIANITLFDQANRIVIYGPYTSCAGDPAEDTWYAIDLTAYLPSSAKKAVITAQCSENNTWLRPSGSGLARDSKTLSCTAADDAADSNLQIIDLAARQIQVYNDGQDCGSKYSVLTLLGYTS